MYAKVFERELETNNGHTVAVLCQRHDFILLYYFLILLETLIHFVLLFITVTDVKILTTIYYSRHHAN